MKKVFVILLCLAMVIAVSSCKQDPKQSEESGGTLTIRPAVADPDDPESVINWGNQTAKFQFTLVQKIEEDSEIEFLMKVSGDVTRVDVRDGSNGPDYTVWGNGTIASLDPDDNGWYSVKVTSSTNCDKIGFTVRVPSQNPDIFISIRNLKVDGDIVNFAELNTSVAVEPFLDVPSRIDVTYTE